MKPLHWVLLIVGVILTVLGLILAVLGSVGLATSNAQRDGRYVTIAAEELQTTGYALTSPPAVVRIDEAEWPSLPPLGELASVRVQVSPSVPGQEIFVGVGDAGAVSEYLQGVPHTVLRDNSWENADITADRSPWSDNSADQFPDGTATPADPAAQDFWTASASGAGLQEVTWDLQEGQWSLVVMNADATRPVWTDMTVGVRSEAAQSLTGPLGTGFLIAGLIAVVLGIVLLLLGAAGLGRDVDPAASHESGAVAAAEVTSGPGYPARFHGYLDQPLSRWLWLLKWLLIIPHVIVLAVLGFALLFTTIAAGIAILITGRYPRSWFYYSVGVLRWSWRVGFYSYSALGTDRYPPFTLASTSYPADLHVPYPERLSRVLVLFKWWLLAFPHFLVVGVLTGAAGMSWGMIGTGVWVSSPSLLGLLVLITAIMLLFTGRYGAGMFNFIMGINRWAYRVSAYALLLRDEYPPFRLDQGSDDPSRPSPEPASATRPTTGRTTGSSADE